MLTPPAAVRGGEGGARPPRRSRSQTAELTKLASLQVPVAEKDAEAVLRLVEALEDHDDVQKVYANFNVPDEVLARLSR